jgi:putative aldouronate transport system substrate-binding protein
MIKKTAIIATVAAIGLTTAACGSSTKSGSGSSPSPSGAASASASAAPSNGPKPELHFLMQYGNFDPSKEFVVSYLKEKTGYDVKYDMLPAENFDEKLNLMVANKETIDFMKLNAGEFYKLASSGALEPLDDLINKYGANIKKAIKDTSWNSVKVNGKIYAIPETGSGVTVGEELVVRQDWLDELGLKMPTTPDELYTVLKTIKEKKNVIPLTLSKDSLLGDLAGAFGVYTEWKNVNGTLMHEAELPEFKEYLAFMNKLYTEGLMDSEMPINTSAKSIEKLTSGKAAMFKQPWWTANSMQAALLKNNPNAKLAVIPFLKDKSGKVGVGATAGTSWFIAVPKYSKYKEDAIKAIDAKLEPETFKGLAIGIENTHYTQKDGKYFPILPKFNDDLNNASAFMTGVDETNYPIYWQARVRKDPVLQSYFEQYQANAKDKIIVDPMSFAPPIDAISQNKQKLNKLLSDQMLKYISGTEPLSNYDKFLADWKAQGGADMIKAANDWFKANGGK